jgi:uncharacterized protein (UPF0335 family)
MSSGMDHSTAKQIRSFVERIENLEDEKAAINESIRDVYSEAKSRGFDVKILRKCVALRKKDDNERSEEEQLISLYMAAIESSKIDIPRHAANDE